MLLSDRALLCQAVDTTAQASGSSPGEGASDWPILAVLSSGTPSIAAVFGIHLWPI